MFNHGVNHLRLLVMTALLGAPAGALAQSYTTADVLDGNTARPDGKGNFNVDWTVPAAYDGSHVAFINSTATTQEIWTYTQAQAGGTPTLTKLLDTTAKAPGGTGLFTGFIPPNNNLGSLNLQIASGKLFFWATDAGTASSNYGLYWISLTGGAAHRIINHLTPAPEGGAIAFINAFRVSGDLVLVDTDVGTYVVSSAGGTPTVVADGNTRIEIGTSGFYLGGFTGRAINGTNVAVSANNGINDNYDTIFVGNYKTLFTGTTPQPVVLSPQNIPGNPTTGAPNILGQNIFLYGNTLYFGATGGNGYHGYFKAQFAPGGGPIATGGSPISVVFSNTLSGVTGNFNNFGGANFNAGTIGFLASDNTTNVTGIYLANGPTPTLVTTNLQRGLATPISFSGSTVAFGDAGFFNAQIDIATSGACGITPVSFIAVKSGAITAGSGAGQYTRAVTLTNRGKAAVTGPLYLELTHLTAGVTLQNNSGLTTCTSPTGVPYYTALASGASLARGKAASATLDFYSPALASFKYTAAVTGGGGTP